MYARDFRYNAWNKLKGKWGTAVVTYLVCGLIVGAVSATGIGAIIIGGPMALGLAIFFMNLIRGKEAKIENLFDGFRVSFGGSLIAALLMTIYTALWSLLFFIPGIVKSYSYSMTMYILADHPEMSASDAITESRKMMDGNKWRLFCLDFSFIGWIILCGLTFGILSFWVVPYMQAARAEFYESIKDGGNN